MTRVVPIFACLLSVAFTSCGDSDPPPLPQDPCAGDVVFAAGDEGQVDPLGASATEARAGVLTADMLPVDPSGLNTFAAGDYVLANDRVALFIEPTGGSDHFHDHGGAPVGVARVENGALVDAAEFAEILPILALFALTPDSVSVLNDGSDGEPAVIRSSGRMESFDILPSDFAVFFRGEFENMQAAIDYALAPGAEHVDVSLNLANASEEAVTIFTHALFMVGANRMTPYFPGTGINSSEGYDHVAFAADGVTGYAWESLIGDMSDLISISNLQFYRAPNITMPACTVHREDTARIHIGGRGLDGLRAAMARTDGETRREVVVDVQYDDGMPASGARVHVEAADGSYVTRARVEANGHAVVTLPDGTHTLRAFIEGLGVTAPVDVEVGASGTTASITFPPTGMLTVNARDADTDANLPARVQVIPQDPGVIDAFRIPGGWDEVTPQHQRSHVLYPETGDVTFRVLVGNHQVITSRGYEYDLSIEDVTVAAGATVVVTANLGRVVDTTDVMCGDFHIHSNRSFDAEDDGVTKVRAAAGEGLEIPLRSEHEWVADFEPLISDLGLTEHLFGVVSLELTTFEYGHFGVFPLEVMPNLRNQGAIDWVGRRPGELFADAHARVTGDGTSAAVIVNHAREGLAVLGFFTAAGYDPITGGVDTPERWSDDFELLEVFNDSAFDENQELVEDWFSFLNRGERIYAVGSSDTHNVRTIPVGYPRTCARLGMDSPAALRALGPTPLADAMTSGESVIFGGAYLEATARNMQAPGGTVTGVSGVETVRVRVQAPQWVEVDTLRVYINGTLSETITLDASTAEPGNPVVRFDDDVSVDVGTSGRGWVVFVASGDTDLRPVHPGRSPFGVTNPIFFEP